MRHKYTIFRRAGQRTYYMYFYDHEGKRTSRSTGKIRKWDAEKEAERFLEDYAKPETTLNDYAKDFYDWDKCEWIRRQHAKGRSIGKATASMRRGQLEKYVKPEFGELRLDDINSVDVENWLTGLSLSNQTKNHILYTFNIIMREARRQKVIKSNPLADAESFGVDSEKPDIFTLEELKALFPEDLLKVWTTLKNATLFLILASTGCRPGEARALCWHHFIEDCALYIEQAAKDLEGVGRTKGGYSRVALLPVRTVEVLNRWHDETMAPLPSDYIFYGEKPYSIMCRRHLNEIFAKAIENAKIEVGNRRIQIRSFRNTYNTRLKDLLPAEQLRAMIGHKSEAMTRGYDRPDQVILLDRVRSAQEKIEYLWN